MAMGGQRRRRRAARRRSPEVAAAASTARDGAAGRWPAGGGLGRAEAGGSAAGAASLEAVAACPRVPAPAPTFREAPLAGDVWTRRARAAAGARP